MAGHPKSGAWNISVLRSALGNFQKQHKQFLYQTFSVTPCMQTIVITKLYSFTTVYLIDFFGTALANLEYVAWPAAHIRRHLADAGEEVDRERRHQNHRKRSVKQIYLVKKSITS